MAVFPEGSAKLCCVANERINKDGEALSLHTNDFQDVWNSQYMRDVRRDMVAGKPVKDCAHCYLAEKNVGQSWRTQSNTRWDETLQLVDETAPYALTGAVFSGDRYAIDQAHEALRYAAGNFYVNDKPTGAVVGQQPFGGARASGTNDKAGSMWNLIRWVSPRTIKETLVPATDYRYPFLQPDE
jgi:hypothetical protein